MTIAPLQELVMGVSQAATGALAAATWQGILLAGAAAVGLRLLPGTPARVRFAIWFAVFVLLAALPFATLWVGTGASAAVAGSSSHAWLTLDDRWCLWIAALWAAASLARAVSLAVAAHRVRALWKRARPVALSENFLQRPGAEAPLAHGLFSGLKAAAPSRRLEVCVSDEVDRPAVIGFFSPRIVLPEWLLEKLTPADLEQIVLHEAGHLSRRDDWMNLLQKLALVVFPLNPALVWIERRLCLERELACDERVLGATGAPIAYAECLARIAEYRLERRGLVRGLALTLGAIGGEPELARRVRSLLNRRRAMHGTQVRFVLGGAMAMLVLAAGALERSPRLVAFSDNSPQGAVRAANGMPAGFGAIAVRSAAVAPAQTWRSSGDAPAAISYGKGGERHISGAEAHVGFAPQMPELKSRPIPERRADLASADMSGTAEAVPLTRQGSSPAFEAYPPQSVETVATMREITPDGDVVLTRWVTVSHEDDAVQAARGQRVRMQRMVQRFAAVPVQGGWLVFQL